MNQEITEVHLKQIITTIEVVLTALDQMLPVAEAKIKVAATAVVAEKKALKQPLRVIQCQSNDQSQRLTLAEQAQHALQFAETEILNIQQLNRAHEQLQGIRYILQTLRQTTLNLFDPSKAAF